MDPVVTSTAGAFADKFGFPALLVLVLLVGLWKMLSSHRDEREKRDERDEKREEARRVEREVDRKAHLDALGRHTDALTVLGTGFVRLEAKVDEVSRDVDGLKAKVG
jgi:hypothetical protein